MFSTPESGKISERWTSVMIEGGQELDEEGRAFMQRYGLGGYPSLVAVTAGGALLDRDLADGRMRTAEYLYQQLEKAEEANQAFLAKRDELLAADDAAARVELGDLLRERLVLEDAAAQYAAAFEEAPTAELVQKRLMLYARLKDLEAERGLLDAAIADFPDAPERMGWRMRRATIHIPPRGEDVDAEEDAARHLEALEGLRAEIEAEGASEDEAVVRIAIARIQHGMGRAAESQANLDWVFANVPDGRAGRIAYLTLAQRALEKRDKAAARESAQKAIDSAPKSEEAAQAHMLLGDLAYGDGDLDAMETHFQAVVELAPGSSMAEAAKNALEFLERRRKRDQDD